VLGSPSRDIERRLKRRGSRYAPPHDAALGWLRWVWVALGIWSLWAVGFSNHSFYRLWRLQQESAEAKAQLGRTQQELARLQTEMNDPRAVRDFAEHALREKTGMARPGEIIYRIRPAAGGGGDSLR
jgi:cell division protein FtsB